MDNKFYVYEHWRLDRDECFYVGKGKGRRAYVMKDRNGHHKAIQAKVIREGFAIEIRMVAMGLSEKEAFSIECERICFWRNVGIDLANMTDGGDGISGFKMSIDAKEKMSRAKRGRPGMITMLGKKHSAETRAKMSAAQKGRPKSPEHAAKVGAAHKGKKISDEQKAILSAARKNAVCTEEYRYKMSELAKKQWADPNKRPRRLNRAGA